MAACWSFGSISTWASCPSTFFATHSPNSLSPGNNPRPSFSGADICGVTARDLQVVSHQPFGMNAANGAGVTSSAGSVKVVLIGSGPHCCKAILRARRVYQVGSHALFRVSQVGTDQNHQPTAQIARLTETTRAPRSAPRDISFVAS